MKVVRERITPMRAEQLLEKTNSQIQRNVKPQAVANYARDMRAGRWTESESLIMINEFGELLNGQHRMRAIVLAGIPVVMTVMYDAPNSCMVNLDRGNSRKPREVFKVNGVDANKRSPDIANALFHIFSSLDQHPTINDTIEYFDAYREEILLITSSFPYFKRGVTIAPVMAACVIFAMENRILAIDFIKKLCNGEGLVKGEPVFALREQLTGSFFHRNISYRKTASAIMATIEGKSMSKIIGCDFPEAFLKKHRRITKEAI